jgi:hypothetical protein
MFSNTKYFINYRMILGSKENYINAVANCLQDPAGITDFHPQIHLNNDAGKLSRLMVATRKYKGIYDMQASRRKATWFKMQKPVVNNYTLGIPVPRSQHLLKILTSITS